MLNESDKPIEFIQGNVKVFDPVRVVRGHLLGLEGIAERTPDGKTFIIITLDILGGKSIGQFFRLGINRVQLNLTPKL